AWYTCGRRPGLPKPRYGRSWTALLTRLCSKSDSGPALSIRQLTPCLVRMLAAMPPEWPEPTIRTSYSFAGMVQPLYIGSIGLMYDPPPPPPNAPPRRPDVA